MASWSHLSGWFRLLHKILGPSWGSANDICHSMNMDRALVLLAIGGDTLILNLIMELI